MNSSSYVLLVLAVVLANIPFIHRRLLGIFPLRKKTFIHEMFEFFVGYGALIIIAFVLESRLGSVHDQGVVFYVITLIVFVVFAFPSFVVRYFWHGRNRE